MRKSVSIISAVSIAILSILLILIVFLIFLRENKEAEKPIAEEELIYESPLDFSSNNDNSSEDDISKELSETFKSDWLGISLRYPSEWTVEIVNNCYENLDGGNCLNINKGDYKVEILLVETNISDRAPWGSGLIRNEDLDFSKHFHIDGQNLLRYWYNNGTDEEGEVVSIIDFVVEDQSEDDYLGKAANTINIDNKLITVYYIAPPGIFPDDYNLNDSEYIQAMDMILQSIDWDDE